MATAPKTETYTITLTSRDAINIAFALGNSARAAYIDDRLITAATEHALAARIWTTVGSPTNAARHAALAAAIDREALEAVLQAEDEEEG